MTLSKTQWDFYVKLAGRLASAFAQDRPPLSREWRAHQRWWHLLHRRSTVDFHKKKPPYVDGVVIMGHGHPVDEKLPHSNLTQVNCARLHLMLHCAFQILSSQQQNGGQGTEFDYDTDDDDQEHLEALVSALATALGVKCTIKPTRLRRPT